MKQTTEKAIPVLFVLPTLGTGGSERVVFNLCLHAAPQIFPVVAAFRDGALRQEMIDAGIACHVLDRRGGLDTSLVLKLSKLIRHYRIRVVNSHHFVSLFYSFWAAGFLRVPVLHTEHSKWEMEALSPFWDRCFRFFLRHIQMVNGVSAAAFGYLQKVYRVEERKSALIPNGIDMDRFRNSGGALVRARLGLKTDELVIGTVGNLRQEKNQGLLLRAVALLQERGLPYKAVLVGDGPCRAELEELAASLGIEDQVLFLGTRTDVPSLYAAFDIYCLCSRYEGMPLTLLEAMAASLPVIGTNVLGIAEVIEHGFNGLLVPDNDAAHLAAAIAVLRTDRNLVESLQKEGPGYVRDNYLLETSVNSYKRLFRQLT